MIVALDPGNKRSALICWDGRRPEGALLDDNQQIALRLLSLKALVSRTLVIERIASMGMPVGDTVFETCVWTGRFMEIWGADRVRRITRNEVKNHLCHSSRAKDSNIRQALIDRLGPVGTKKEPGALYGIKKDLWAALAVGVTWLDLHPEDQ